jgi:tetratricopeptide (TPR) repeat protein
VDSAKVIANGTVRREDADKIVPYIDIRLDGSWILKSQLMVLDMLANNDWDRPIYFVTGYHNDALGLEEYFQLEGLAYRLVPIKSENKSWFEYGRTDTDILYDNVMNKFIWRGANDPDVWLDYYHKRTITVVRARLIYTRLANELSARGDTTRANEVLERCMEVLPVSNLGYDIYCSDIISAWFKAGNREKAVSMTKELTDYYLEHTGYWLGQKPLIATYADQEIAQGLQIVSQVMQICYNNGEAALAEELNGKFSELYTKYVALKQ